MCLTSPFEVLLEFQSPMFEGFQKHPRILNLDNLANQTSDWNGFEIQIPPNPFRSYKPNGPLTKWTLRGHLVRRLEFYGIGIHQRNLTMKELEWNLTTRLIGRNSIPSPKPRNGEFLKLWNSTESIKFIPQTKRH